MPFRHVIKNFVIHGGDFDFDGAAQKWILKAKANGKNDLRFGFLTVHILLNSWLCQAYDINFLGLTFCDFAVQSMRHL